MEHISLCSVFLISTMKNHFLYSLNQKMFNAEVEEFIRYMVAGDEFRKFVQEKLEEKVDVYSLETEREQLQKQLKQVQGSKLKLIQMLDRLDTGDKHYTRKYQDMQDRLDNLYDKVAEFEEAMKDIDAKIGASYGKEITGKKLYEFLLDFDILYDKMTDMEKKEFMNTFIEKIELKNETVNNGTGQGSRIEHIDLAFPVYYGDCKGTRIRMPEENTVDTIFHFCKPNRIDCRLHVSATFTSFILNKSSS